MKNLAVAMALVGLVACGGTDRPPTTASFDGSDAVLYVDLAKTAQEQAKGLMGIEMLPADEGMAFVFDGPTDSTFWMKDTLIPLSIAFVDEAGAGDRHARHAALRVGPVPDLRDRRALCPRDRGEPRLVRSSRASRSATMSRST